MKAVILAGGEGTRLKPLTSRTPKPLMPVAGRPCIDFVIRSLIASGFREIVITTAYMSDTLIQSIGDGLDYGASILYSFEGTPAGTAGAVRRVANFIGETFVVAMGDVLADVDFRALYEFHRERRGVATIALTRVQDPTQYGIAAVDPRGRIVKFREKPRREEAFSDLANAGIYVLEPEVLEFIPPDQKFDFAKDVFPKLLAKGLPVYGKELQGMWMDIGRPRDLWRASMEVVRREGKLVSIPGVATDGPMILQEGATVEAGATLHGPVFLAAGARSEVSQGGLGGPQPRLLAPHLGAELLVLELGEELALGNPVAFLDVEPPDASGELGAHIHLGGLDGAGDAHGRVRAAAEQPAAVGVGQAQHEQDEEADASLRETGSHGGHRRRHLPAGAGGSAGSRTPTFFRSEGK